MANKWIDYVYKQTDYCRGDLAVAHKLADAANKDTDQCSLKIETIARDTRLSIRQVKRILNDLEMDGFLKIERFSGRGKWPEFTLKKVTSASPFSDRKKVTFKKEKVTLATLKGDIACTEKVTLATSYIKEEPLREPKENPKREDPPASAFGPPRNVPQDLRFYHPALKAIRDLTGHNPDKVLWDALIEILGLEVDVGRLKNCFSAWVLKGYKKSNYSWITDWYVNGIPKNGTNNKPTTEREKSGERAVANELFMQDLERRIANGDNPFLSDGDDENHIAGYLVS